MDEITCVQSPICYMLIFSGNVRIFIVEFGKHIASVSCVLVLAISNDHIYSYTFSYLKANVPSEPGDSAAII